jgi:catechol 2,3-dioxygenase-like lactoylglutathione lyase family enzyme
MDSPSPPGIHGVLETAVYVDDLTRSRAFYEGVMGLKPVFSDRRMAALNAGGRSVLLLFVRGASTSPIPTPGGTIPPHDGNGPLHFALWIAAADLPAWERHLSAHGVPVQGRVEWPQGSTSIYFRDPDNHLVELATPGIWGLT